MSALVAWVFHLPFCPRDWFKSFIWLFGKAVWFKQCTHCCWLFVDWTHDPLSIWNAWIVRHVMNCTDMSTNNMMISYEDRMIMTLWWWGEEATKPSSSELNWAKNAMLVVNLFWKEEAGILWFSPLQVLVVQTLAVEVVIVIIISAVPYSAYD